MPQATIRVLLIEDDPATTEILRGLIAEDGDLFALECVDCLERGFAQLAATPFDLVLLDFGLPDSSGIETFTRAYAHAPHIAIIPLTGSGDEALALKAIQLGAQDYLHKAAVNRQLLSRSMRYAVERKRGQELLRRAHDELEQRVKERTAELSAANAALLEQIGERERAEQRLRDLSNRLVEVQETERRAIARELHDEIGQQLTGLKLALEMTTRVSAEQGAAQLREPLALVNELMQRVRELSLDLRPALLDDLGLLHALLWHFERYTAQTGVRVEFQHLGIEGVRFQPELEIVAYRLVQEALTNVARHAQANAAAVTVTADAESLALCIADDGIGFNAQQALAATSSSGLTGMRERAQLLNGSLTINAAAGQGAVLTVLLPLAD